MDHDDFWLDDGPLDHDPLDHEPLDHDPLEHASLEHGPFGDGLFEHEPDHRDPADEPWPELPEPDGYQVEDLDVPADPDGVFPPELDLPDLPEPVDGWPWVDGALLGGPGEYRLELADPTPAELAAYAGEDGADWAALRAAEDPATAALARFWSGRGPG
jgi:hypothetical protein